MKVPSQYCRRAGQLSHGGLLLALLVLAWPAAGDAAKTDIVILQNGDRITGEVKGLSRGKLDYNTDDAGRLAIEWIKVAHVTSSRSFEIEIASGAKYVSRLAATDKEGALAVEGRSADTLAIPSVVRMSELDAGFLQRVKTYLDVGFTFAQANRATTLNLSGESAYRGDKFGSTLSFDSYAQGQESTPTTTRNSGGLQMTRFLPKRWSAVVLALAEQNDELNLALRLTGGGAVVRVLIQSNKSELAAGGGLTVTRERFSPTDADPGAGEETKTNLEALLVAKWDAFRFDSPKLDFSNTLNLYPSLSTPGRVRGELTTRLKYELFADFNVGINLTDTFDSRPPDENAPTNDFITSFTIGWSYRR